MLINLPTLGPSCPHYSPASSVSDASVSHSNSKLRAIARTLGLTCLDCLSLVTLETCSCLVLSFSLYLLFNTWAGTARPGTPNSSADPATQDCEELRNGYLGYSYWFRFSFKFQHCMFIVYPFLDDFLSKL